MTQLEFETISAGSLPASTPVARISRVRDQKLYINRELSWLQFNARVLAAVADSSVPLFKRLKFMSIFSSFRYWNSERARLLSAVAATRS